MITTRNKWEPLLFSGLGVAAMFFILLAAAAIGSVAKVRVDLTADHLYTLSAGTRKILKKIDTPVVIHFYCTQSGNDMPIALKNYAKRVEDLLAEYRQASGGKIEIDKFDPQPDSDAEDLARLDGIEGQSVSDAGMINLGEKVYLGLAVKCLDQQAALPFLDPSREKLLEYDLTRAIAHVVSPQKQTIGVMSSLPLFGQMNPMMMRTGQGGQEPWVFLSELKQDFTVRQVEMTADKIDDDIQVLVVVHPAGITDKTQYALDQFVLRGGKLVAFLDPLSVVDARNAGGMQNMLQQAASGGSTLDKLLKAWGLEFDVSKVVADKDYVTQIYRGDRPTAEPTWLSLTGAAINQNDVVTSEIDNLLLPFVGVFTGTPAAGLKETVLLKTSANSQLVDKMMAQFGGGDTGKDFVPSGKSYTLALRLMGKFKTAFPNGKPADTADAADKTKDTAAKTNAPPSLQESKTEGVVVLVGDSDMLYDQYCVRVQSLFGQKLISPFNGNLAFIQNLVEQLAGDSDLIGVRSRAVASRPFVRVKAIQAAAEETYRAKIKQLQQDLDDARQKVSDLQQNKDKSQRFILSKEQQDEINRFQQKESQTRRELKAVRKQLRKDVDALETRIKWTDIAGMPLLVSAAGVTLAMIKRKRTAAK